MEKLKKIFNFLNKHPFIYFIIFVLYGWIVYKYYTLPTSLPKELMPPSMNNNMAVIDIEYGMYLRAKNSANSSCNEKKGIENHFCLMGWNYYNFIYLIYENYIPKQSNSNYVFVINNQAEAIAFGGAIKNVNLTVDQLKFDSKWKPFVEEGYGFFGTYVMYRERFNYPLSTMCPNNMEKKYCEFGVGQAGYYVGYSKNETGFSEASEKGAQFASILVTANKPENPSKAELAALAILNKDNDSKGLILRCLEKKHPLECI